jgi:ribonuclease HI
MHLHIYTDGSQIKRPNCAPKTGYGFYIREWNIRVSRNLPDPKETNNRAELYAIAHVIETVIAELPSKKETPAYPTHVLIYTDSQYCLQVISKWILKPKTDITIDAPNADLIGRIRGTYKSCMEMVSIQFLKVQAHTALTDDDKIGNHIADELANGAASEGTCNKETPTFQFGKYKGMEVTIASASYIEWLMKEAEKETAWTKEKKIHTNIEEILDWWRRK